MKVAAIWAIRSWNITGSERTGVTIHSLCLCDTTMPPRTNKVIISCALTGGIHTPTMSPALPVSPDMLAEQGVAAAQAGAAILHVHARDARDGRPTPDPAAYLAFLPRLKEGCEAIINVTTGGSLNMT